MTAHARYAAAALVAVLAGTPLGCSEGEGWEPGGSGELFGYSTERPFPAGIRTVAVDMLESREFRRNLEFELTEALVKRIEMDTPYRIADKKVADTIIVGEILEVEQSGLGYDLVTGRPRETGANIIMRYRWQDQRSGRILAEHPRFSYTVTYVPPAGETFETGMMRGLDGMAEAIVETMETDW